MMHDYAREKVSETHENRLRIMTHHDTMSAASETHSKRERDAIMTEAKKLNGAQMAALIGADPKDFRRWLRSVHRANGMGDALPGSGGQYGFDASEADDWAERYAHRSSKGGRRDVAIADLFADDDTTDDEGSE